MSKMRKWKKVLVLAVTAAFFVGFIHDLGSIKAEESSEQTEVTTETEISASNAEMSARELKEGDDLKTEALDTSVHGSETSQGKVTIPPPEIMQNNLDLKDQ